jgi:hypothetical protein
MVTERKRATAMWAREKVRLQKEMQKESLAAADKVKAS